jgi:hypothetical protein
VLPEDLHGDISRLNASVMLFEQSQPKKHSNFGEVTYSITFFKNSFRGLVVVHIRIM